MWKITAKGKKKKMSKKNMPSIDCVRIKQEIKEESRDYDAAHHARDRLKGALQDLQAMHSDNSTDSEDYKVKSLASKKGDKDRNAQKKKKHKAGAVKEVPFQHTFVMKLFDRSVDLAQFEENTPLYPICRAWMANKPRSYVNAKSEKESALKKLKKDDRKEKERFKTKLDNGFIKEIYSLPPPLPLETVQDGTDEVFPQPMKKSKDFKLPAENERNLPSKEALLANHITHWCDVKKKMRLQSYKREKRFEPSKSLLKRIFHNAQ